MGAQEELKNGYILIKVLGRGAGAKVQMTLNGEREEDKDPYPKILEPADLAGWALRKDPTLRASTRGGKKVRVYRKTPQGGQEIATLTPHETLRATCEMDLDGQPGETHRVLMVYREAVSGIPKLVVELSLHLLKETEEPCWAGTEESLIILENGDTRQELIEKMTEKCREKLDDLQRKGELEEWANKKRVPVAKIDQPSSHETGFEPIRWECHKRAEG